MKKDAFKIVLLVIILLSIAFVVNKDTVTGITNFSSNQAFNLSEKTVETDPIWERVNRELFNKDKVGFSKYDGPFLVKLYNATAMDSIAITSIFKELRVLLPNKKIDFFKNYTGIYFDKKNQVAKRNSKDGVTIIPKKIATENNVNLKMVKGHNIGLLKAYTCKFYFSQDSLLNKELTYEIKRSDNKGIAVDAFDAFRHYSSASLSINNIKNNSISGYIDAKFNFGFKQEVSLKERKRVLELALVKLISCKSFVTLDDYTKHKVFENDKLVLQKMYSVSLMKDYKAYMYKTYPWRHATYYISHEKSKIYAIRICVVLGLIVFVLGFSVLYKKKFKYIQYLMPLLIISLFTIAIYKLYLHIAYPFSFGSWRKYMMNNINFALFAIVMALLFLLVESIIRKKHTNFLKQFIFKLSSTFIILLLPYLFFIYFDEFQELYLESNALLILALVLTFGRGVLIYLNHFSESLIKEKDVELSRLKELNAQNELKSLHAHINPHFLYNALNSIASLAHEDANKTEEMTISLSDLFQYSINRKGKQLSTIEDEVTMVENYLKIEKIRFEDRLNFTIDVEESLLQKEIPMYVLQPLIENAVKHGIAKIEKNGKIGLTIKKKEQDISIEVTDNGPAFPKGVVSGHGLQSVYDLLRLSYGDKATMNWENAPEKKIEILITQKA